MALYYYARKLQKGAKVSQPCSYSTSTSSGGSRSQSQQKSQQQQQPGTLARNKCCKQQAPPQVRLMTRTGAQVVTVDCTQAQCHPHPHHCHTNIHCCPNATHSCCGCSHSVPKQCPCHQTREPKKINVGLSHSRSLRSLEQLELNCSPSVHQHQHHRPLPLHPPCCSMLHRSESQYDNVVDVNESPLRVEVEDHHHHKIYQYDFEDADVDVDKDQDETHRDEDEACGGPLPPYRNVNSHENHLRIRHQNSASTSTLTEDQFQFQEGNADDDLDKEIQEIYAGKRVSKKGLVGFPENYLHSSPTASHRHRNLMQEPPQNEELDDNHTLCYNQKGQLISGSWDSLLEKVVIPWVEDTSELPEDDETIHAFLLCSRLHNPPHLTIATVFKHFSAKDKPSPNGAHQTEADYQEEDSAAGLSCDPQPPYPEEDDEEDINLQKDRLSHLVRFVRLWTELLPHDFRDDRLMHYVRIITRACMDKDSEVREDVSTLWTNLITKLTALEVFEATLRRYKTESSIGEPIAAPSVVTICPSPASMAEQLSLVELEHFSFLGAQELVAQLLRKDRCRVKDYSRMNGSVPSSRSGTLVRSATTGIYGDQDITGRLRGGTCCGGPSIAAASVVEAETDTQNLDAFIFWFRRLAMYVASEICKMAKKKSRARVIEYWVQVGKECLQIRNFNSLMAILAGLSCRPVARLKKTWSKINCADLIELQTAMDPKNNFSAYRAMYKASVWNSLTIPHGESHNYKILVPYFALLLRDVYNLNSLYPSKIKSNGHINFEKYTGMSKLIKEIMSWQTVPCPFTKIPSVFNAVQALPVYTEEEVTSASYGCEVPDGAAEKEHFNRLKKDQSHRITPLFSKGNSPIHYLI